MLLFDIGILGREYGVWVAVSMDILSKSISTF